MIELDRRDGPFGLIRILERRSDGARLYCIDQEVQTMVNREGESMFGYVHAIKLMAAGARSALLVGGAGASLANMLARRGCAVTVIDIDPHAKDIAQQHFGLDTRVRWLTADARPYIEALRDRFDAIIIDACDVQGLIPEFAAPDALAAAMSALNPGAPLIVNLVGPTGAPDYSWTLASAMAARGFNVTLHRPEDGWEGNEILHVCADRFAPAIDATDLRHRPAEVRTYLMSLRAYPVLPKHMAREAL
jgi:spermidine synthase